MTKTRIVLVLALAGVGCGPSGGAAGSGGGGGGAGGRGGGGAAGAGADAGAIGGAGGGLTWDDDGVTQVAEYLVVTRANDARYNYLEVSGTQLDGPGLSLSVSVGPAGTLGGSYPCNPADATSPALFLYSGAAANTTQTCTITITEPGTSAVANAKGSFEAVLNLTAGGTKAIANGRFDVPVMPRP